MDSFTDSYNQRKKLNQFNKKTNIYTVVRFFVANIIKNNTYAIIYSVSF